MALSKEKTTEIIKRFGKKDNDTGSCEVQIALLSERIKELTAHLKANLQDKAAKRSLMILVGKRRSLLDYLSRTDNDRYVALLSELGLRH